MYIHLLVGIRTLIHRLTVGACCMQTVDIAELFPDPDKYKYFQVA